MVADTDIANEALYLLKAGRITSLTQDHPNAIKINDIFESVRDKLLRSHNWNFASKQVKLAKGSTAPVFEFDNAYPLPDDWIRTISVHNNDAGTGMVHHQVGEIAGQGVILTSADELWLRYVYRVTDPNRMTADFHTAFAYRLAIAVPGIPNQSVAARAELRKEGREELREAKFSDASGATPERRPAGSWVTSRGGWPSWRAWPD